MELKMDRETARIRSSTWPLPDPTQIPLDQPGCENGTSPVKSETPPECESPIPQASVGKSDKKMRNAWGNMSYAEMITQAVLSSPEKRLTLSEIYEWIVRNVPYFADKANSPSTAGWKNSVRHNLSLHSRFVKIQNDNSGKSSWWTVDLDAKSTKTSRRRSHSVDNTNAPSPKSKKREKRASKLKKVKGVTSSNDILSSPLHSPTTSQPHLQAPWSPNPSCPSPTGSDLSPCYSPVLNSPILPRTSRNVTPVSPHTLSPLISPPSIDQQNGLLCSSSPSLLDGELLPGEGSDTGAYVDMFAQLNLRSSREGMGSSSSLSSLNSPRLQAVSKSPHPVFTFNPPLQPAPIDSSGYSSSAYFSDTETVEPPLPPPPPYEDYVHSLPQGHAQPHPPQHRPACYTPTRAHPLHISLAAGDTSRPRSGSEPAPVNLAERFPTDIDMELFTVDHGLNDWDMDTIIRSEMQYENGELDFRFDHSTQKEMSRAELHYHHMHHFAMPPRDPTLTSVALQEPMVLHGQVKTSWS